MAAEEAAERGGGGYVSLARLVRRAQKGDPRAFDELYARTVQLQYFTIVGRVGCEAAPDILQELYTIAWQNITSVRPRAFVGYLNATSRHLCLRHFKRAGTSKQPVPVGDRALEEAGLERGDVAGSPTRSAADPASAVLAADEHRRLVYALWEKLDDRERDAVLMRYYQKMKLDDIAASLEVSRATVKRLLVRALGTLRESLGVVPASAVFADLLTRVVDEMPAPRERRDCLRAPASSSGNGRWLARAAGVAAVSVALGSVAFAAGLPRAEVLSEDSAPLASPPAAVEADTAPPLLTKSEVDGDVTELSLEDESGVTEAWCVDAEGVRFDALVGAPANEPAGVWRFKLPSGTYELHAVDGCGNVLAGSLEADIVPDAF